MDRRLRFVAAQTAWMYIAMLGLTLFGMLTFELFFIASLIGFLIVVELTAAHVVEPRWRVRLKWLIVLGFVGFGYVAIRRIFSVLSS